ncbi:MAG: energy-coupling factor transporter ATPase [Ruminococcaceae bacterium]|nr:energy-coupling factor transporter ATPase [Oscillospiraceae bacterium]
MKDNIICVKGVSYEYTDADNKKQVLENFNLEIERGSFTVIIGHNGSGKSTLAKLLNGLYKPTKGDITVDGLSTLDTKNEFEIRRRVGLVFQNPDNQIVASVVEDDVAFGPENLGVEPAEIRTRVDEALKSVGMYDHRFESPHQLSGGQKQRVAIAGIIAMSPECIVLDEPTAMLDPKGRQEVMETLLRLNKELGITVVLITHFMEEAENANRAVVMNDGAIVLDDEPKKVFGEIVFLKKIGLAVPQTSELLYRLKQAGLNVSTDGISVEECAAQIAATLK